MAVKSVIDIQVNDAPFKEFINAFNKYKDDLGKMPGLWGKVDGAVALTVDGVNSITDAIHNQTDMLKRFLDAQEKVTKEIHNTNIQMTNLSRNTNNFAGGIKSVTMNLLKWGGITAGVSSLFGMFSLAGLMSLGRGQAQNLQSARGVGVSPAEFQAANIAYSRVGGGGLLSSLANMKGDPGARAKFSFLTGISDATILNSSAADLVGPTTAALGEKYRQLQKEHPGQEAMFFNQMHYGDLGVDIGQMRTMADVGPEELAAMKNRYSGMVTSGAATREGSILYQNFIDQMDKTWTEVKNRIAAAFAPLAKEGGPITEIAGAFASLIESGLTSQNFKDGLTAFTGWMNDLAINIKKPEFKEAISNFIDDMIKIATSLGKLTVWLADHLPNWAWEGNNQESDLRKTPGFAQRQAAIDKKKALGGANYVSAMADQVELDYDIKKEAQRMRLSQMSNETNPFGLATRGAPGSLLNDPDFVSRIRREEAQNRLQPGSGSQLISMESSGLPSQVTGSHVGLGQLSVDAAREMGLVVDPQLGIDERLDPNKNLSASLRYLRQKIYEKGGDVEQGWASYNMGGGAVASAIAQAKEKHVDWVNELSPEAQNYVRNYDNWAYANGYTPRDFAGMHPTVQIDLVSHTPPGGNVVNATATTGPTNGKVK